MHISQRKHCRVKLCTVISTHLIGLENRDAGEDVQVRKKQKDGVADELRPEEGAKITKPFYIVHKMH